MNKAIAKRNELRKRIWDLDSELSQMLAISPEYRNQKRVDALKQMISEIESEIEALADA